MQPDETQDPLALALSLDLAPTLSPDDAAANAVLAKRYQLPVEMVQQYHADYKKQAWYEDAITTTQDSPILKSFLANENHAKIMQDDLSNLVKMEGASTSIKPAVRAWDATKPSPTVGDVAYGIGMALPQGIGAAVYGTGRQLGDFFGIDELSRYSAQQARLVQKSIQDTTPEFESAWSRGLYGGATSTARMIPAIAAGLLTKNPNVLLATLGIQTEAEAYSKYRERGGTSAEAFVGAMTEGTVEVATELLPMGFMMQTLGKTGMGTFLTGLLAREIPTEQLATFLQDATDTAIANPDKSWGEFWRERPGAAVETAFATLVPTAFFGVLHKVVTVSQNHQADVQATERVSGTLQVLSELSAASKVRPRPGQTFSDYIESVTDGTPVQEVALSPLALQQSGQAEEAMNLSPSIRAQYESALTLGTDMVIPTAEYLSTIAPTELGGLLLDDLKVPGESMTRKEAREYVAQQSATFDAVIATQVSEHLTRADLDASSRVVGQQILTQLQQTTRYTKEQAKDLSVLIRSFYDTTALKAGMTPEALFTQIPYSVQGAGTPSTGTLTQPAFAEANYRPEVSAWAKTQFGDRTAPNNSAVWQNFTRWFGDSKVVDKAGKPLVVYHGTDRVFEHFDTRELGRFTGAKSAKKGFFFTSSSQNAGIYAGLLGDKKTLDLWESELRKNESLYNEGQNEFRQIIREKNKFRKISGGVESQKFDREYQYDRAEYSEEEITNSKRSISNAPQEVKDAAARLNKREADAEDKVNRGQLEIERLRLLMDASVGRIAKAEDFEGASQTQETFLARTTTPNIIPVYLALSNPLIIDFNEGPRAQSFADLLDRAKAESRDGAIFKNVQDPLLQTVYVVFSPTQIKSSTGNNGDFDSTDQSILNQPARDRSVDEIHAFATANQIAWDDDPAFMDFTESVTGKRKIDALTQPERNRLYAALESRVGIPATEEKDWTQHEPTVTSTGKIKGAPDWVKTTRQKTKMRQMLRQFVQEGLAGRYWYEQSARGIMTLVGGNVRLAEKFIQLIAVYSPNSNVWGNTLSAVKAFTHWKMGRSAETFKVGMPEHDKNAMAILYQNASWDGRKTNSFYLNLMYEIIQTYPEQVAQLNLPSDLTEALAHTSTIDVWMARAFGYVREQFGDDKGEGRYSFAENEVRRLTAELNRDRAPGEAAWLPHQVQAAIWTAMKTRYELADVKAQTNAKGFKDKILTVDQDGKTIYPADTAKDRAQRNQHYANWRAFALKASPERVIAAANATSRSFADELQRMTETVTFEALPTASHNHEVNRASLAAREAFTAEARALLMGPDGQDLLAKWLGIALQYSTNGYGGFEKNISPVILAHLLPKRTTGQKGFSVDEVRLYARAVQYIMMQDAVPWFRPDNKVLTSQAAIQAQKFRVLDTASKRTVKTFDTQDDATAFAAQKGEGFAVQGGELSTAVTFRFTSALTQPMLTEFFSTLQSYLGPTAGFTRTAVNEIMVANFRDDETKVPIDRTDEDFLDRKESLIKDHGVRLGVESHINFWIQGEYGNVHDWSNDIQGDRILREVGLSGRPDLHPWLHDRRLLFEGLLSRYSGEGLADAERAVASNRLLQEEACRQADPSTSSGEGLAAMVE